MKRTALFLAMMLLLPVVLAGVEGTPIGGEPYLAWKQVGVDYFVMFNSFVDDQMTLYNEENDRQADTCILESSFTLAFTHIPDDAVVDSVYLIWMGAVDPAKFEDATDNAVHLKFSRGDGYIYESDIFAGDTPKLLGDTSDPFLFESVRFSGNVVSGCTETNAGTTSTGEMAFFTYRVPISSFFQKILDDNRATETPLSDGAALLGQYTVSGLDCTDSETYRCNRTMVSNWSIILVYDSGMRGSKNLYFYKGLSFLQGETTTISLPGFDLPQKAVMKITVMSAEGDTGLVSATLPLEGVYINRQNEGYYQLQDKCNPYVDGEMSFEIYNSNSSVVGWDPATPTLSCITGGTDGAYFGIDVDTFLLDNEKIANGTNILNSGTALLNVMLKVNQDAILTNYFITAVDTRGAKFDIPVEASDWPQDREKIACSCRAVQDPEDVWCEKRPMFFLIKVQDWGLWNAQGVTVVDELDTLLDYVAGSTEIATKLLENGEGIDWTAIPDKAGDGNDAFPLSGEGYKIADTLTYCDRATWTCSDTRLIRFKVTPKEGPFGNRIIYNMATIKEEGSEESTWYRTNKSVPLRLHKGTCLDITECAEPSKANCGGEMVSTTDDDAMAHTDGDSLATNDNMPDSAEVDATTPDDGTAIDDTTVSDTDTKKDDGCGCAVVF